jgi:hypothetical protein
MTTLSTLFDGLTRAQIEMRLRSCWAAQQRAELAGDSKSAEDMRERIDQLLDLLPRPRVQ